MVSADLTALGATLATGAETRVDVLADLGYTLRGVRGRQDRHLGLVGDLIGGEACCESVGPTIATTLSVLISVWKALIAPASSPAVSWMKSLIGRPLTPPFLLKKSSAILRTDPPDLARAERRCWSERQQRRAVSARPRRRMCRLTLGRPGQPSAALRRQSEEQPAHKR